MSTLIKQAPAAAESARPRGRGLEDLAIFGSRPAFDGPLHVGRPNIGNRDRLLARIEGVLDRAWLTNHGPCVQEFEAKLAAVCDVKHCITVCNATAGLEIAIRAAGIGGEVIVPSFTFVATAHALSWLGITPVFCDVDPRTHTLDPREVERLVTDRTTAILGVHLWGRPSEIEALQDIAWRHQLRLIFDAAHAFGCTHHGRPIGGFGDCEVFSFHATKFFNTFEGGAVTTNNDELARTIRLMSNFGFAGYDDVVSVGTNGKMSEMAAVMGLTGLESLEEFVDSNRRNFQAYQQHLRGIPGIHVLLYDETERCNYQYVVVEVDQRITGISRDDLAHVLHAENVLARRYFSPGCHNMKPYRAELPDIRPLPQTERLARSVLVLPTGTAVNIKGVAKICQIIRLAAEHGQAISRSLSTNARFRQPITGGASAVPAQPLLRLSSVRVA